MHGKLLFLGTGGSMGIPVVGCCCPVCVSSSPQNKRQRSSVLLTINQQRILVDAGPDFRRQMIDNHIDAVDGLIITHAHNDHIAGIDDVRAFFIARKEPLPCLLSQATLEELKERFNYIFSDPNKGYKLTTRLDMQLIPPERGSLSFLSTSIDFMTYEQSGMLVNGFRFGDLAYVTDIKNYPATIFDDLKSINTLVISALRFAPSHMHLSLDEAIDFASRCEAKQTFFTHIAHEMDHHNASSYLPKTMHLAYDGLEIKFSPKSLFKKY